MSKEVVSAFVLWEKSHSSVLRINNHPMKKKVFKKNPTVFHISPYVSLGQELGPFKHFYIKDTLLGKDQDGWSIPDKY